MFAQVVPEMAGVVGEPVRMLARLRQQQDAGRFQRRGGEHHDPRLGLVGLARRRIDERHAARLAGLRIHQHLVDGRVGAHREVAGVPGRIDQPGRRIECRMDVAAADAAEAGAAAVAARAVLVVREPVGGDAEAERRDDPALLLRQRAAHVGLGRVELDRPLVDRVRQPRQILGHAGNAEIAVDPVVVRRDVGVFDRPVVAVAVAARRLEVVVGQAQRKASPDVGLAAERARAHPREVGAGVGVVLLVDEELLGVVRAFAELLPVHHVGVAAEALRIGRLEPLVVGFVEHVGVGRQLAAARMVIGPLHRADLFLEVDLLAGLQHQHVEAVGGEHVRRHAAGRARADDQHVVELGEIDGRPALAASPSAGQGATSGDSGCGPRMGGESTIGPAVPSDRRYQP